MKIRSVSLAILRKEDRILVQEINFPDIQLLSTDLLVER